MCVYYSRTRICVCLIKSTCMHSEKHTWLHMLLLLSSVELQNTLSKHETHIRACFAIPTTFFTFAAIHICICRRYHKVSEYALSTYICACFCMCIHGMRACACVHERESVLNQHKRIRVCMIQKSAYSACLFLSFY